IRAAPLLPGFRGAAAAQPGIHGRSAVRPSARRAAPPPPVGAHEPRAEPELPRAAARRVVREPPRPAGLHAPWPGHRRRDRPQRIEPVDRRGPPLRRLVRRRHVRAHSLGEPGALHVFPGVSPRGRQSDSGPPAARPAGTGPHHGRVRVRHAAELPVPGHGAEPDRIPGRGSAEPFARGHIIRGAAMRTALLVAWIGLLMGSRMDFLVSEGPFVLTPFLVLSPIILALEGVRLWMSNEPLRLRPGTTPYLLTITALFVVLLASTFLSYELGVAAGRLALLVTQAYAALLVVLV